MPTYVLMLINGQVELVWEIPFFQSSVKPKVLGNAERGIWKKLIESMKRMRSCLTLLRVYIRCGVVQRSGCPHSILG